MKSVDIKSNVNEDKSQLVQMRLQPKTLKSLENISGMTHTTNRT